MQEQGDIELLCPKHGEKIISASLTEAGENQMFCLKCVTQTQIPIQQLTQQLTDSRQNKIKTLIQSGQESEKRLGQLMKLFLNFKEQFNQQIDNLIMTITDEIKMKNQNIKQEIEQLNQSIQQLNLTQVNLNISELIKKQQEDDLFIQQDESLRNLLIQKYLNLIKQFIKLIKEGSIWEVKANQNTKKEQVLQQIPVQDKCQLQIEQQLSEYQELSIQGYGFAIVMDKNQKILISGDGCIIQIWDFFSDGTIKLKQTLKGHHSDINTLCFSQKENWFISGSDDKSMKIWKKEKNDKWICQQKLEDAHEYSVSGIIMNNDEDEFFSCSDDKTIKVWRKVKNGIQWKCVQTLTQHNNGVKHLSLNGECNLLASSSGWDQLRIWEKNNDQLWELQQVIDYLNDWHLRIKFINNELIATTTLKGRILRYIKNHNGVFVLKLELKLNEIEEQDTCYFPIIYNEEMGLMMVKHSLTYILKRQENDKLIIHQTLNGDYQNGYIFKDGKYLILANKSYGNQLVILKRFKRSN